MSTATAKPFVLGPSSQPIQVSKTALGIIIAFGIISIVALIVVLWFLFSYTCSRRARRSGYAIRDGRNEHAQWWKNANPPVDSSQASEMSFAQVIPAPDPLAEDGKRRVRTYGGNNV